MSTTFKPLLRDHLKKQQTQKSFLLLNSFMKNFLMIEKKTKNKLSSSSFAKRSRSLLFISNAFLCRYDTETRQDISPY